MKAVVSFVFLALVGASFASSYAGAQKPRAAAPSKLNFSKFTHKSHKGAAKSLIERNKTVELDCAYCHGTAIKDKLGKDQHDVENIGYPSHLKGMKDATTHSACTECHAFTGTAIKREMCTICHEKFTIDEKAMATNIPRFPNPNGGGVSQFYDFFSHKSHISYYSQSATDTPLKDRVKFFNAKATDPKVNKGLEKDKFECAACHTMNSAPAKVGKIEFAAGVKMSAPGHPDCFVCHMDSKIVEPPKPNKPDPKNTFATNCTGCHQETGKAVTGGRPVMGSELSALWFARQIVNTELNPPKPKVESPLPFSHKTHDEAMGSSVADCLQCHVTAKKANTMADFYRPGPASKENQPLALKCYECHDTLTLKTVDPVTKKKPKVNLMKQKIEGAVTLATSNCNYCHSLTTIKMRGANGIPLPPPSHFGKKVTQPAPPPATPPAATGTPAQPVKPTPMPTPAPTKTPAPEAKPPASTPPSTTGQTAQTATATANADATAVVVAPAPPKPSPAPTPAPTQQAAAPPPAGAGKTGPTGIIRLGDPKESPHWGQHNKWGVVENFNHGTHIKPTYSDSCQDCHHTNKDARVEEVAKCISCHKEAGHADTDKKGGGINVEDAYHGIAGSANTKNKAGCIECHKAYIEKKPDSEAPIKPCAACHTEKQARLDQRNLKPRHGTQEKTEIAMRQWMRDFRSPARR